MKLKAYIGDITAFEGDAIVNAAHPSLEGGGGVDGAIHRAAGPELKEACMQFPVIQRNTGSDSILSLLDARSAVRCETGDAKVTDGFNLPARKVVHAPGPRYNSDKPSESQGLLIKTYVESFMAAMSEGCETIAYPAISTGIFGYPLEDATIVAVDTLLKLGDGVSAYDHVEVSFVCFDYANFLVYDRVIKHHRIV